MTCAFKWNQRETIWSLAVLAYQANWLFGNWEPSRCEGSSNEIVQHVMSGRSTRGLFADKAVQTVTVIIIIIIIIILVPKASPIPRARKNG